MFSQSQAANDLDKGNVDLNRGSAEQLWQRKSRSHGAVQIIAHYNAERPGNGQAAAQIVEQLTGGFNQAITHTPTVVSVEATGVKTKNLTYIDFLLPGMIGLSVMQIGIFSVAFAFVSYKSTGMLRRLQATPTRPGYFLTAQGITRLIMAVLQTALLATIGIVLFNFHLAPSKLLRVFSYWLC